MKTKTLRNDAFALLLLCLAALSVSTPALAQSGGTYDLTWSTIDGGGYMASTGGTYSLGGTIGQPDAGSLTGGSYTLQGGFWVQTAQPLFMPLIAR